MKENIEEYLNRIQKVSFNDLLFTYIDELGCKDSDIYKKAEVDRKLFSKIRCSKHYIPKKNVIIKLSLALKLDRNKMNNLLSSAGYALSNSNFDLVISYCLENKIYDLNIVNDYLFTYTKAVL